MHHTLEILPIMDSPIAIVSMCMGISTNIQRVKGTISASNLNEHFVSKTKSNKI